LSHEIGSLDQPMTSSNRESYPNHDVIEK